MAIQHMWFEERESEMVRECDEVTVIKHSWCACLCINNNNNIIGSNYVQISYISISIHDALCCAVVDDVSIFRSRNYFFSFVRSFLLASSVSLIRTECLMSLFSHSLLACSYIYVQYGKKFPYHILILWLLCIIEQYGFF